MSNIVIQVQDLSKRYQLGTIGYGSLQHDLKAWWAKARGKEDPNAVIGEKSFLDLHGEFWALSDVGFEVKQGDRVGVLGRNGAGKSTLLKLLSRVTGPTSGTIKIKGRIASLLEVGTGFHPELTGRENVFLNGAILGMKRREIQAKFDEIVGFSGVDQFIDTPVKRYSSGMYVRLAFSVAAHLDSEILIIDEVLAVGDAEFQKKCLGKMEDVSKGHGRTIIFVSHFLPAIKTLCNTGLFLEKGKIGAAGTIDTCIDQYLFANKPRAMSWSANPAGEDLKYLRILAIDLLHTDGSAVTTSIEVSANIELKITFDLKQNSHQLTIGFVLFNSRNEPIYRSLTTDRDVSFNKAFVLGQNVIRCSVPTAFLTAGEYFLSVDASIYQKEWIINPAENKAFGLVFHLQNSNFSNMYAPHGLVSPLVVWEHGRS